LNLMVIDKNRVKKILVIKLRAIGDVLLSTVVLENLRSAFPHAVIDFLVEKPGREVIEGNPAADSAIVFDNKKEKGLELILRVRRYRYDLVIDLFGNPRSAIVTLFSGAKYRVGYRFKWRQYCYNIVAEPRGAEVHNTEFNLDALRAAGVPVITRSIRFPLTKEAESFADSFIGENHLAGRFLVALNPGGGWYTKRWRIRHFARFGDEIAGKYKAVPLIIWGPGEEGVALELQKMMKAKSYLIPPCGLKGLAAILGKCSALVTNDSGPMHIAAAVGTPVAAIFGPTNPMLQGPVGEGHEIVRKEDLSCLGCNYTKCPIGNPCMEELCAEDLLAAFARLIEKNNILQKQERAL